MWIKILCYFCCQRGKGPKLSKQEKRKKWFRLVGVMTLKQYGTQLISNFFYAFLIAEALFSMKSIWSDFKEYSDCNNEYTANLTRLVSEQYSQAADELALAVSLTSECIMGTLDVDVAGVGFGLGDIAGGVFGDVFGWFSPGDPRIPTADLNLQSNSEEIMEDVADDMDFLGDIAFWFRMIGFIMTFVTIAIILLKATFYTVENLPWKPGAVGLTMRFVEAARVVAVYVVLMTAVFLQAYLTDKSCQVNVNNTVIETPMCEVVGEQCEFVCVTYQQNFSSPCTECDIKYAWWWVEPYSWPNILGGIYLVFLLFVVIVELIEARTQKKELKNAEAREKAEKERIKQEKLERKKRQKTKKKKKSKNQEPPEVQSMEDNSDTFIDIESDGYEAVPLTKKSKKKTKKSKQHEEIMSASDDDPLPDSEGPSHKPSSSKSL